MSILSSFKKALGFPDEYDDDFSDIDELDDEDRASVVPRKKLHDNALSDDARHTETDQTSGNTAAESDDNESDDTSSSDSDNESMAGEIFDAVIELFNATQPDFVRDCLNVDSQRNYILNHISKSVSDKLKLEIENARRKGERKWNSERQKINADLEKLKSEYYTLKQQREEYQSAQLSAARQKRALGERIHDLELQVKNLEAEKEQFQLENRSMVNKLRVASVRSSGDESTEAELQRLANENIALQDQISQLKSEAEADKTKIAGLEENIQQLSIADENRIDQQEAIAEIEAQIQQFETVKARKDKKISDLSNQNRKSADEIKTLNSKLAKAEADNSTLSEQIHNLRTDAESQKAKSENTISELRAEIKRLTELINAGGIEPTHRSKPGRKSKKANGQNEAEQQQIPTEETTDNTISESDVSVHQTPDVVEQAETTTTKISAIDELMDSTDWFIAPEPATLKKDPEVEEEFGYKEPPRKPSHDDDKQLSLW